MESHSYDGSNNQRPLRAIILGGKTRDFHQFEIMGPLMKEALEQKGLCVELTEDRDILLEHNLAKYDVLVIYTTGDHLNQDQVAGLVRVVAAGKGVVGLHGATASFKENHEYVALMGGKFIGHPPIQQLNIHVADAQHPITAGIEDFSVVDELYLIDCDSTTFQVLLDCEHEGKRVPVAWVRPFGKGRVFYLSLGHGPETHTHPIYQELVYRGIRWAAASGAE